SILFYRKSAFTAARLDPEKAPASWDELYEYAQKLTTKDRYGIAMPNVNQLGWVMWGFQAQDENSAGYYLLNEDWTRAEVNTEFHQKLFTMFKKIYDEKLTPAVALSSYNEIKPLAQDRVAMDFGGSWSIGQIKNNYPDILDDVGFALCPTVDGITEGKTTAAMGGWGMAIDGKAKHPKECGEFIEWLLGGDVSHLTDFMGDLGYSKFAARASVEEALSRIDEAQNDPFYRFVSEKILPYAKAEPVYEWEVSKKYADALDSVTTLHQSVTTALSSLQNSLQSLIEAGGAGTYPFGTK
ncbi:MAG: extracellular solute-binding protein, partial [Candidatus Gallimonas sp.]